MKTAIEKMINYLEEDNGARAYHKGSWAFKTLECARSLLAEEQARKLQTERQPLAQDGLMEMVICVVKWLDDMAHEVSKNSDGGQYAKGMTTAYWAARDELSERIGTIHPAPTELPLAELAERKGKYVFEGERITDRLRDYYYFVSDSGMANELTESKIFDSSEQARTFLMSLPDKE